MEDQLLEKWNDLKGQARQHWSKLTMTDVANLNGKTEELAGLLQQRYGYGPLQAELEINDWLWQNEQRQQSRRTQ